MSRLTPSDTYRIWKKGKSEHTTASPLLLVEKSSSQLLPPSLLSHCFTAVRVDTTLIGFQNLQWLRGGSMISATVATRHNIFNLLSSATRDHLSIKPVNVLCTVRSKTP